MPFGFGAFGPEKFSLPELPESPIGPFGPRYDEPPPQVLPPPRAPIVQKSKVPPSPPQTLKQAASSAPIPEPSSYLRFNDSMDPSMGPMEEFTPGPRQSQQSQDEAYQRYLQGTFGIQEAAELSKASALDDAYRAGNLNPTGTGATYARSFTDKFGNVTGWEDKAGGVHKFAESPGRSAAVPYEERKAESNHGFATDQLRQLEELAKKHDYAIGPYAAKYNNVKRAGLLNFMGATIDPEVAKLYSIAESLQNAKIYDSSGKAINEAEMARLKPTMPNVDRSPEEFWVNLENFKQELANRGYSLGKGAGEGQNSPGVEAGPSSSAQSSTSPQIRQTSRGNKVEILD